VKVRYMFDLLTLIEHGETDIPIVVPLLHFVDYDRNVLVIVSTAFSFPSLKAQVIFPRTLKLGMP